MRGPAINEAYSTFKPVVNVAACIARLLGTVPDESLAGLSCVSLRDEGGLSSRERAKRRKRAGDALLGTYYPATAQRKAGIDLFVDKILAGFPVALLRIPLVLDVRVGRVLFHEIGHHLDARVAPGTRSREGQAESWSKRLLSRYLRRRYWYLIPLRPLFSLAGAILRGVRRRSDRPRG